MKIVFFSFEITFQSQSLFNGIDFRLSGAGFESQIKQGFFSHFTWKSFFEDNSGFKEKYSKNNYFRDSTLGLW
jgi:hypothetical protein